MWFVAIKFSYGQPSSTIQISDPSSIANSFTETEELHQLCEGRLFNHQSHSYFGTQQPSTELKSSPAKLSHESAQMLITELKILKSNQSQPSINTIDASSHQYGTIRTDEGVHQNFLW